MREILFRGQTRKLGEKIHPATGEKLPGNWVYGGVLQGESSHSIIYGTDNLDFPGVVNRFAVHTDTLGQYTGLTDKNGKRIFEGDVVKTHYANTPKPDFVEQVVFLNGRFCCMYEFGKSKMWSRLPDKDFKPMSDYSVYMEWCEVIGNIHDNPELIAEVEGC